MTRVPCLVIYVGDGNQSPEGIKDLKLAQRLRSELMRLPIGLRAGQRSRTPANLSVALTKATAMWQGLDVADALSHTGAVSSGSVFAPWSRSSLSTQDGGPLGPSSPNVPSQGDTLGDTDFVAWILRVAPECRTAFAYTCGDHPCYCLHHVESRAAHLIPASPLNNGVLWPHGGPT